MSQSVTPFPSVLFQLGSFPELSFAELQAVVGGQAFLLDVAHFAGVADIALADALHVFTQLGGCVKLLEVISSISADDVQLNDRVIQHLLPEVRNQSLTFHFAGHAKLKHDVEQMEIKRLLSKQGIRTRFLEGKDPVLGLSAAQILHEPEVVELVLLPHNNATLICRTRTTQNIESWTTRDRGRPAGDHARGMLPPKVARIMVNLGLPPLSQRDKHTTKLFDPFCGVGTIVLEAISCGVHSLGADLDEKVVVAAAANAYWLTLHPELWLNGDQHAAFTQQSDIQGSTFFTADVHHPPTAVRDVTVVVTEPYLGKQTPHPQQIANIRRGLEKLYLGAFRAWKNILQEEAKVVIIFPLHGQAEPQLAWAGLIDKLKSLGYNLTSGPWVYARPGAIVRRSVWVFTYRSK